MGREGDEDSSPDDERIVNGHDVDVGDSPRLELLVLLDVARSLARAGRSEGAEDTNLRVDEMHNYFRYSCISETSAAHDDSLARRVESDGVARRTSGLEGGGERELVSGLDGCTAQKTSSSRVSGFGGSRDERGHYDA